MSVSQKDYKQLKSSVDVVGEITCRHIPQNKPQNNKKHNDLRSGLVFEAGINHFDRRNRLHRERPQRITDIMEALKKSKHKFFDRCCILKENETVIPTQSAVAFLDDDDYLRCHWPGYMKR